MKTTIKSIIAAALIAIAASSCTKSEVPNMDIQFTTENLWFTLPQSPIDSVKYYVHVDAYANNVAIITYLNVQPGEKWNQYIYVVNAKGVYTVKENSIKSVPSKIPTHDTVVYYHNYPIFL